jgi:hypothetical protein
MYNIINNADMYLADDVAIAEKRYKSLIKNYKVDKSPTVDIPEIPFRLDHKTVLWIKKTRCFKTKHVKLFGLSYIKKRIKEYEELRKEKNIQYKYWNPY